MQYASIVINSKTKKLDQKFTYLINPKDLYLIKPGVLVEVPFGKKKLRGVVWSIKKFEIESVRKKLKPIYKVLDINIVLNKTKRKLAEKISSYYLCSIGEVVFFMIPPTAKRIIIKQDETVKINSKQNNKIYTLYESYNYRIQNYIKLILKAISTDSQALVLVPELNLRDPLLHLIKSKFKKVIIFDTSKTTTQRYKDWIDIRAGKYQIVIGTRSSIFLPLSNLGLVIIDRPSHFSYKEEQTPKYNSINVAKWLCDLNGANLILGDVYPSVTDKYYIDKKKYFKLKSKCHLSYFNNLKLFLVDSSNEKSIISWQLEKKINNLISLNRKICLFIPKKGSCTNIICNDCKFEFKCKNCNLPLVHNQNSYKCYRCNKTQEIPKLCPNCKGTNIIPLGSGIDKVEYEIKKLFPKSKILKIDKDNNKISITSLTTIEARFKQFDIIIATQKIFSYPDLEFDLTAIISIDNILNLPDYNSSEKAIFTILNLAEKTKKEIVIQTFNIEKHFFQYLTNQDLNSFSNNEILLRKKHNYPPFSKLIKIIYQHQDKKNAQKQIDKIYKLLQTTSYLPCRQTGELQANLIGPNPCFIEKIREKFRYQILIKYPISNFQPINFKEVIESLPTGSNIDVDPISLL